MVDNGRLAPTALTKVQGSIQLATPTAEAWRRLRESTKVALHRQLSIASPAGGYRSFADQEAMRAASIGHDAGAKQRWGLSTVSSVALASPGTSNHGLGLCVDVEGTAMDDDFLDLAKRFGFTRPFADRDPNHFLHDGTTQTKGKAVVKGPDDTLHSIADAHGISFDQLLKLNPWIGDPHTVAVGSAIRVG